MDRQLKNKLLKILFITIAVVVLAAAITAFIFYDRITKEYGGRAAKFDLSKIREMESASFVYDRNGELLGRFFVRLRDTVPLEELPYEMVQALVAAEDNSFFEHHGVDYKGMIRAAISNYRAERITQGASTLTMQLARNTFELRERSYERKLVETFLAWRIEENFTKNEILELYLNRVYYGFGMYGVEAAARGYFGKSSRDLTLGECAMLAGLLKSPNNKSPWANRKVAIQERDYVLGRMRKLRMIDRKTYKAELAKPPNIKRRKNPTAQSYAIDYVRSKMKALGFEDAYSGGYRIYTTIDSKLQTAAEKYLARQLRKAEAQDDYQHPTYSSYVAKVAKYDEQLRSGADPADIPRLKPPQYLQGSVLMVDNNTGAIRVIVGGRDFNHSEYNRALYAKRPTGTSFLSLVYAAGYEKGYHPGYLIEDAPMDNRQVMIGGTTGILGEWGPERDENRYEGMISARYALTQSKNAASVRFGNKVGLEQVTRMAKISGINSNLRPYPATFLGSSEATLLEMTRAYTMFAEGGIRPEDDYIIDRVTDKDGKTLYQADPSNVSVIRQSVAYQIHTSLAESLELGTADKARARYGLKKFEAGGKTGTAYNFTDLWFLGYSSEVTCGVWVGFDKPRTSIYRGAFSSSVALPVWVKLMNDAADVFPPQKFEVPESLRRIEICRDSGYLATEKCVVSPMGDGSGFVEDTAYLEYVDAIQMPEYKCPFHNPEVVIVEEESQQQGQWPRAAIAVNLNRVKPISIEAPAVIGEDPYGVASTTAEMDTEVRKAQVEVRRAEAPRPLDQQIDEPVLTIEPPAPLEF